MSSSVRRPIPSGRRLASLRVLQWRESLGLSQLEAAQLWGISERCYGDIERGKVRMVALEGVIAFERVAVERRARAEPPVLYAPVGVKKAA